MQLAAVLCAAVAATGVFARLLLDRSVHVAALAMVVVGWGGLLVTVAPHQVIDRPLWLAAAAVVALLAGGALAHVLQQRPLWLAAAVGVALPLRLPVPLAGQTYNLLLPLYAVIGVSLLVLLGRTVRGTQPRPQPASAYARVLDVAVVAIVLVAAMTLGWTLDQHQGRVEVALFYVPFAALYLLARTWLSLPVEGGSGERVRAQLLAAAGAGFVGVMTIAAAIGLWQEATQRVWSNPKLEVANRLAPDFRTNSIFWDPNIYGRYLVAALAVVLCVVVFVALSRLQFAGALAIGATLLAALWFTYSQSSFIALAVACLVISLMLLRKRGRIVALALAVLVVAASIPIGNAAGLFAEKGRLRLAEGGVSLIAQHPVAGVGIGSFEQAYATFVTERGSRTPRLRASHTTPVTIAVELGIVGIAAYAFFLTAAVVAAAAMRRTRAMVPAEWVAHRWAAATLAAIVVHSLLYAGFFEDPLVWVTAATLASLPPDQRERPPAREG